VERIDEIVARKRTIFGWYRDRLAKVPGLTLNPEPPHVRNQYWMVTALWGSGLGKEKGEVMAALSDRGIDTRPIFHPLSSLPAYAGRVEADAARGRNTVAYDLASRGINLPSALSLTEDDVDRVCRAFLEVLGR
jgi:perosamine synthetase